MTSCMRSYKSNAENVISYVIFDVQGKFLLFFKKIEYFNIDWLLNHITMRFEKCTHFYMNNLNGVRIR